jgi:hypothetical protein
MQQSNQFSNIKASIIDDQFNVGNQVQSSSFLQTPSNINQSHPAFGLQQPQPLKLNANINQPYEASKNTFQSFNTDTFNQVRSSAMQSGAIRGRVTSPHVYQYDMKPVNTEEKRDFGVDSGMKVNNNFQVPQTLDPVANLREAVTSVYIDAMLVKTHQMGPYSVYKCPVENLTSGSYKYIVAIVPNHDFVPLGVSYSLKSLPWISFQTRTTENPSAEFGQIRPSAITYKIPYESRHPLFDKIKMVLETDGSFTYLAETMPCKVELIKLKPSDNAAQKSNIMSALEAFKTIITVTSA